MNRLVDLVMYGVVALVAVVFVLAVTGCVGMVNDYATVANAFGEEASRNTIVQLQRKHDLEAASYAAAFCGQPRVGAVDRRYQDPVHRELRRTMCDVERMIGFAP